MVKVLGHWELGYHAPITEQFYWSLALRDLGVDEWSMVPVSGIKNQDQVPLTEWEDYNSFFEAHEQLQRVFLEPRTAHYNPETTWLHEFEHPENCVYIFGSAHYNPTIQHCREDDVVVSIKTMEDAGILWSSQAVCLTLYDRMIKSWQ